MQTLKIKKFQSERRYCAETCDDWFELVGREDKELTFKVYSIGDEGNYKIEKATAVVRSDEDSLFEETTIINAKGVHVLNAYTWIGRGRRMSELPIEETERIKAIVREDVERRKRNGEI